MVPGFGVTGSVAGEDGSRFGDVGERRSSGMGKAGDGATDAKEQARARRIEMETDWQQLDDRIDEATAAVIVALAEIASARDLVRMSNGSVRSRHEGDRDANPLNRRDRRS